MATRENTMAMKEMDIAQREAARQDTRALRESLEADKREYQRMQLQQAKNHDDVLLKIAKIGADAKTDSAHIRSDAAQNKPLPPRIATQLQENLDAIGLQSAIESDLKALEDQIDSGKLKLGMVENAIGSTKNFLGLSDENSRNQASLKATVEKMRNDSLRVNKGVQTEGDAIRAFNELLSNLNDPQMVKQRFSEIRAINRRGVELQKRNVDMLRQEYGKEPMDFTGYENQPAAVGKGTPSSGGGLSKEEQSELEMLRKKYGR
jgi:hypothetical protein